MTLDASRTGSGGRLRSSRKWATARRITQAVTFVFFFGIVLLAEKGNWAVGVLDTVLRLDPLLVLAHTLASRLLLGTSALALILVVFTILFGRAWCGWLCPLGTLLDWIPFKRRQRGRTEPRQGWRKVKFDLLLLILFASLLGNLTLLYFDPLTIFTRTTAVSLLPSLDRVITTLEGSLYRLPWLAQPVGVLDSWIRPAVLPIQPEYYREALLLALFFISLVLLNGFAARFWCRYLCPLGGLLGWISRISLFQRRVDEQCTSCKACTKVCPTGTIDPENGFRSDPAECTLCMECLPACSRGLNSFKPFFSKPLRQEYDAEARDALVTMGAAVVGVTLLRSLPRARVDPPFLIRPPGVRDVNLDPVSFTRCLRCGTCVKICPTGVLQPASSITGVEGIGTPVLIPRLGYCDFSCNACGQACPVQAIPPLSLEQKQVAVIGKAFIDQSRCLAWADHTPCIVCEEMCPLPEKAIQLEEAELWAPNGKKVTVQLPHVLREKCIGCGICEYKCPLGGEAAIRVYTPQASADIYQERP